MAAASQYNRRRMSAPRADARVFLVLMDSTLLLDYLQPADVINALYACHEKLMDQPIIFYSWVYARLQQSWPALPPPASPPAEYLHPRVLLRLLEQLHVITTYQFSLRFNQSRCGTRIRAREMEEGSLCRVALHGTIYGDLECIPNAVSYWECRGVTMGCYLGIAQELDEAYYLRYGFHFGRNFDSRPEMLLSKKMRACDLMPAIMYGQTGDITTGEFRGPRLPLPTGVRAMQATPIAPDDTVGICVDLWQGQLLFILNGVVQTRIALDKRNRYIPVFSFQTMASSMFMYHNATPPWHLIYDYEAFRDEAQYLSLQLQWGKQATTSRARAA